MRCQIATLTFILGLVFAERQVISSHNEVRCQTADGSEGICMDMQKCPNILRYNPQNHKTTTSNQGSSCPLSIGNYNQLCCPIGPKPQMRSAQLSLPWDTLDLLTSSLGLGGGKNKGQGNKRPHPKPTPRPTTRAPPTRRPFIPTTTAPPTRRTTFRTTAPPTRRTTSRITAPPTTRTTSTTSAPQELPEPRSNFPPQCGIRTGNTVTKIVGGSIAKLNSWPWMAALFLKAVTGTNLAFICGGSLINKEYVLTAAHCLQTSSNPEEYVIRLGEHDVRSDTDGAQPLEIAVLELKVHEGYQSPNLYNDIALIRLEQQIFFNTKISPVCLPSTTLQSTLFDGWTAFVTGWGLVQFGGAQSSVLREVSMPIVNITQCDRSYRQLDDYSNLFGEGVNVRIVCAGLSDGGRDACQGDSGGPLTVLLNNGRWNQIGIVSFGHKCGEPGFPGAYTRITEYIDWISENIFN